MANKKKRSRATEKETLRDLSKSIKKSSVDMHLKPVRLSAITRTKLEAVRNKYSKEKKDPLDKRSILLKLKQVDQRVLIIEDQEADNEKTR